MTSTLSAGLALLGGLLTVLSPCVLPILPAVVGRSLQSHRYGPIALVAGLVAGFALAGSLLGITASWFTHFAAALRTGAIALLLLVGLLTLFPRWGDRLWHGLQQALPRSWVKERDRIGLSGEFWLGTQLGLLWTPCAGTRFREYSGSSCRQPSGVWSVCAAAVVWSWGSFAHADHCLWGTLFEPPLAEPAFSDCFVAASWWSDRGGYSDRHHF